MFDKPLDELNYADVRAFLDQEVPEGPSLDYKRELTGGLPDTACAFANTAGGYILLGVGEGKEDLPDPDNIPGLDPGKKPRSAAVSRITSRTRPTVVPEVSGPIELDDGSGKVVLVVHVRESRDAPHEVMGASPRILVRRGTKNESIGLVDVERLISRRNAALEARGWGLPIEYLDQQMATMRADGPPPVAAIVARPYKAPSFRFDLDAELDREIEQVANAHDLGPGVSPAHPTPYGLTMALEADIGWRGERQLRPTAGGGPRRWRDPLRGGPVTIRHDAGGHTEWGDLRVGHLLPADRLHLHAYDALRRPHLRP